MIRDGPPHREDPQGGLHGEAVAEQEEVHSGQLQKTVVCPHQEAPHLLRRPERVCK